jgi:hypothetical protein
MLLFQPEFILRSPEAKAIIFFFIICGVIGVIVGRAHARRLLKPSFDDKALASLVILPLLLTSMFTTGCLTEKVQETWSKLTPAEQTLVIADALQKGHLRLKEVYNEVYAAAAPELKIKMSSSIAPKINKAQPIIELFVSGALLWNETQTKPDNIDILQADAQAAFTAASTELQALATSTSSAPVSVPK